MSELKKIFKKQGGWNLIKQYLKSGVFFTALLQFLILGRSKTSLEILRLTTDLKIKQKLGRKYKADLIEFNQTYNKNLPHEKSNKVWVCWFQGIENAPEIVKICYKSLKENLLDKEIILITEENMKDFVQFPDNILKKWKEGKITNTHMTDLLRLELLIRYGGIWFDATVLCTGKDIPDYILDSDLFFYQCLKPGKDGHSQIISSWLMSAKTNNKILMATRYLCYKYWKKNDGLIDYFLLHKFISIVLEFYPDDWNKIVPVSNSTPHILLLRLFDKYDDRIWKAVTDLSCFHKLTYKLDNEKIFLKDTYYEKIVKNL